jgi:hypothetical protein
MTRSRARNASPGLATALLVAGLANLAESCFPAKDPTGPPPLAAEEIVDAPLGFVSCSGLSTKSIEPWESNWDALHRPYHLLLRVLVWPDLEPFDVDPARLVVPTAETIRHVGPGEYFFGRIAEGRISAKLLTEPIRPGQSHQTINAARSVAQRNPVTLKRHAITTCDLLYFPEEALDETYAVELRVLDQVTGEAIATAGAGRPGLVCHADQDGRIHFPDPVRVADLFTMRVESPGYRGRDLSARTLDAEGVRAFRETGVIEVRLFPEETIDTSRPLYPPPS